MIVTVTSYKGGVGKTTTAIHLAAYLQRKAPTLLVDGDAIRSATKWSQRGNGNGLPFKVVTHAERALSCCGKGQRPIEQDRLIAGNKEESTVPLLTLEGQC